MTIGERIKARRKELGLSVDDLAHKLGKNRATIYRYESNEIENLPTTILEPLARVLYTSPAALMGWIPHTDSPAASADVSAPLLSFSYTHIPVGISAGQLEDCEAIRSLPKISVPDIIMGKYARDPNVVFMHVNGESMNRIIENGATIAVMTGVDRADIRNGDIVIARHDGEGYTIKRYYDLPEKRQIILTPDSNDPSYLPIPISYDTPDDLRLFGKVVLYSVIL